MAFRDLRRKTAEIDEQHRESMRDIDAELGELHFGTDPERAASRRSFLTRAAAGGAIAFGATAIPVATMIPAALAQTTGSTPGSAPGTTKAATPGTTAAGSAGADCKKLEPKTEGDDLTVVIFAQTVELAVAAAYEQIIATGKLAPAVTETARVFARHHQDHASTLGTWAGCQALNVPNAKLLATLSPRISSAGTQKDIATVAYDIEEGAASTYDFALGVIEGWEVAEVVSTILPVEAQHAIVWSQVIEPDPNQWATQIKTWIPNFQSDSGAYTPSTYAVS